MAEPLDDMIDAAAQALRIPLDPSWKAEVKVQLQVNLHHGAVIAAFPLPDEIEPAPVFKA